MTDRARALSAWMLGAVALAGCAGRGEERVARRDAGVSSTQSPAQARVDRVRQLATAAVHAGCAPSSNRQSVPLAPSGPRTYDYDVVFYTAHPDDESMYAGGTLARLARAHRRVALVVLSHGEGGRLLVPGSRGELVEVRDRPRADVVRVRDAEMARAAQIGHAELSYLNPAEANADYEFTTSCGDALAHWDRSLPGGVAGIVEKMIRDIRNRRPRVVVTMDPRDDPTGTKHGHHRAVGALAELAAVLAADPTIGSGAPHTIEELLAFAPKDGPADVTLDVDPRARLAMLRAHASQFRPEDLAGPGSRPNEQLVIVWRAGGVTAPPEGSILATLLGPP